MRGVLLILMFISWFSAGTCCAAVSNAEKKELIRRSYAGDADASYELGYNLTRGFFEYGKKKGLGFRYMLTAAKQGHREAMYEVGDTYLCGKYNQRKSKEEAKEWFERAAALGHKKAIDKLATHFGVKKKKKKPKKSKEERLCEALQEINLESYHIKENNLPQALAVLRAEIRRALLNKQKSYPDVNIILEVGATNSPKYEYVTSLPIRDIDMKDASLADVLDTLKGQIGFEYAVEQRGIVITYSGTIPSNQKPPIEEKTPDADEAKAPAEDVNPTPPNEEKTPDADEAKKRSSTSTGKELEKPGPRSRSAKSSPDSGAGTQEEPRNWGFLMGIVFIFTVLYFFVLRDKRSSGGRRKINRHDR